MTIFLAGVITGLSLPVVCAGDKSGDYLKDGKLKEPIEILELQGGFAGLTGTYYAIAPDGSWSTGPVKPPRSKKGEPKARGKLKAAQLAQLSKALATHDLATLPNHGAPVVNPQVIIVRFGKKTETVAPRVPPSDL